MYEQVSRDYVIQLILIHHRFNGLEIDSVANFEATSDTRFKKVRKAESMGINTAAQLEVSEKKMRRDDGVLFVENEAGSSIETATASRPSNWETLTPSQKAHWRRWNRRRNK